MLLALSMGQGWSSQFLGWSRRSILRLPFRRFFGLVLFTRNGLFVVVTFCVERVFHPIKTGISSFLFKRNKNIALDEGLVTSMTSSKSSLSFSSKPTNSER